MSSMRSTFANKSFRDSLSVAVTQASANPDSIRKGLRSDTKAPRGVDPKTWLNVIGAVRLAYLTAAREDRAEVFGDIRASLSSDFSDAEVDQFLALLGHDDAVDARNAAVLGNPVGARDEAQNQGQPELFGATGSVEATTRVLINNPVRPRF